MFLYKNRFLKKNAFASTDYGKEVAERLNDISSEAAWRMYEIGKIDLVKQYFQKVHNLKVYSATGDGCFTIGFSKWKDRNTLFGDLEMSNEKLFDDLCARTPFREEDTAWILHVLQEYTGSFSFGDPDDRGWTAKDYMKAGRKEGIYLLYDVDSVEDVCRFLHFCFKGGEDTDYIFNLKSSDRTGGPYTMGCYRQEREIFDGIKITPLRDRTLLIKGIQGKTLEVFEKVRRNWFDLMPFCLKGYKDDDE